MSKTFRWVREMRGASKKAFGQRGRQTEVKSLGFGESRCYWSQLGFPEGTGGKDPGDEVHFEGKNNETKAQKSDKPQSTYGLNSAAVRHWRNRAVVSLKGRAMPHTVVKTHWYNKHLCISCVYVPMCMYVFACAQMYNILATFDTL